MINPAVDELAGLTSTKQACDLLGRARGSHYRDKSLRPVREPALRPAPPNKLTDTERAEVLGVLTSPRFCDKSVAQTWAALLDEGTYLCSMSTMHRLLRENEAAGERRPGGPSAAEEARADGHQGWAGVVMGHHQAPWPNPRGLVRPLRCARRLLRFVVAWTIAACEDGDIAKAMLEEAMGVHGIPDGPPGRRRRIPRPSPRS